MTTLSTQYGSPSSTLLLLFSPSSLASLDLPVAFSFLLSHVTDVLAFNQRYGTEFRLSFVELPFSPVLLHLHAKTFVFNQLLSVGNYHLNETASLKLWRFNTEYGAGPNPVNVKGVRLHMPVDCIKGMEGTLDTGTNLVGAQVIRRFSRYLRTHVEQGVPREEQPPLGLDGRGRVVELPAPELGGAPVTRRLLQEQVNQTGGLAGHQVSWGYPNKFYFYFLADHRKWTAMRW